MSKGRTDGDEPWEVGVFAAEAVADPRTHAGADKGVTAGVKLKQGAAMARVGAVDAVDDAEVINSTAYLREEIADWNAALAAGSEFPRRTQQVAGGAGDDSRLGEGQLLAVVAVEQGLVVEGVHLGWAAVHEEKDDPLGLCGVMPLADRQRLGGCRLFG